MIRTIIPGQHWDSSATNRMHKRLREIGDLISPGDVTIITLTPCLLDVSTLPSIQNLAQQAVDPRCICFGIDFGDEWHPISALFRAFSGFDSEGNFSLFMPMEERIFTGVYLGTMYPNDAISDSESLKLGLLNSLITLSFSGLELSEMALKARLGPDGNFQNFAQGNALVAIPSEKDATDYLKMIQIHLPPEAVFALQSAASQTTLHAKFIFTWIAFEFTIGSGNERKKYVESLGSNLIKERINRVRETRAGILKSDEKGKTVKASDVSILLDVMRLYMLKDRSSTQQHIARIEEKIKKEQAIESINALPGSSQNMS